MRKFNHSFSRVRANLVVLTQATRVAKQRFSSLPNASQILYSPKYQRDNATKNKRRKGTCRDNLCPRNNPLSSDKYRRQPLPVIFPLLYRPDSLDELPHPKDNPRYLLLFAAFCLWFNGIGRIFLLIGIFSRHFYQVFKN